MKWSHGFIPGTEVIESTLCDHANMKHDLFPSCIITIIKFKGLFSFLEKGLVSGVCMCIDMKLKYPLDMTAIMISNP